MIYLLIILLLLGVVFSYYHDWWVSDKYPAEGDMIRLDGTSLHYKRLGTPSQTALPLLCLHGASCNLRDMELAFADLLGSQRELILVDRPGHGHSARDPNDSELAEQARKIGLLLDHLNIPKVIVCGQSYGAAVALAFALQRPDLTGGLLLLAPVSHPWPGGVAAYHKICANKYIGPLVTRAIIAPYAAWRGRSMTERGFRPQACPEGYYDRVGVPLLFRSRSFRANSKDIVALHAQVTAQSRNYGTITVPTEMLAGSHDLAVLASIHCRGLQRQLPNSRFSYVDDVGHPIHHAAQIEIKGALKRLDQAIPEAH